MPLSVAKCAQDQMMKAAALGKYSDGYGVICCVNVKSTKLKVWLTLHGRAHHAPNVVEA